MIDDFNDLFNPLDYQKVDLNLDRISVALKKMGQPCRNTPAIQIVGTNGKGSITSFIQSCLQIAGVPNGVTTSPHLISWCERIQVNGEPIPKIDLRKKIYKLKKISAERPLTPFELLIASALDYFANQNVEILVLEAGLGGRLDATTAHPYRPIIAFGSIGLDHCERLGESLKDITKEKAAVISPGSTVISCKQLPEVSETIETLAKEKNATLKWVQPISKDWKLGLAGDFQRENAAVAKGCIEALAPLGWQLDKEDIKKGFSLTNWPARLQLVKWNSNPVIIDGAHNPPAAQKLAMERINWPKQELGIHWILGIQLQKKAPEMLNYLIKPQDIAWIVPIPNHKSWNKTQLLQICPYFSNQLKHADQVEQVLLDLLNKDQWPEPPPIIAGSLYLLGDLFATNKITSN